VMDASLAGKWICPMHPEVVKEDPGACDICGMPLVRAESLGYVGPQPGADDKPLVVPATAVLLTGKRAIVYVEVPDQEKPTYEGREIVLGPRAGDYYLVKRGLAVGDRVVTKGAFTLDAELQIQAKPSMMTPDAGGGTATEESPLPALAEHQLHAVIMAAQEATAGSDLAAVRSAYQRLGERVKAVNGDALGEKAKALWREYAMLIGNDAAVGAEIKTLADAKELAKTTQDHLAAMQKKLGLEPESQMSQMAAAAPAVNPEFIQQLGGIVAGYLNIQTALTKDDPAAATMAAKMGLEALAKVNMELVQGQDHMDWMKFMGSLKSLLTEVATADGIEPKRAKFALLSEQIAALLTRFGVPNGPLYKAWCPMAFDGRGASWVQQGEDVRNPYFGEAMLQCGEVKEVLK